MPCSIIAPTHANQAWAIDLLHGYHILVCLSFIFKIKIEIKIT
jgi:hypothetical protein